MFGIGLGVSLLLAAAPPCLPVELGALEPPADVAPLPAPAVVVVPVPLPPRPARPPAPTPPPVSQNERARYRVDYGPIPVGEVHLYVGAAPAGAEVVRAGGTGTGAVLGLGRMRNMISSDLDLARLDSRGWVNARENDERAFTDHGEQREPGHVTGVRVRAGHPGDRAAMDATLAVPLLDPLAFLLRLRIAPPAAGGPPQILYVLDGRALWRVTVKSAGRSPLPEGTVRVPTLRLDAEAEPIRYDGANDEGGDRQHRSLALWLSDDANRVPLRMEMPLGPSAIVVALTDIERRPAR